MELYVEVSGHAVSRLHERFPELANARGLIASEVLVAIAAGRMATKRPRWCVRGDRRRRNAEPWIRFVWNEDRTRVYPIDRRRKHITVITVIRPEPPAADTPAA